MCRSRRRGRQFNAPPYRPAGGLLQTETRSEMAHITTQGQGRRSFLKGTAALAGASTLTGFEALGRVARAGAAPLTGGGYGPPQPTRDQTTGETLIALPRGFEYVTFGRT